MTNTKLALITLLLTVACVPVQLPEAEPMASEGDTSMARKSDPEQIEAYAPPFKPVTTCQPSIITHLGVDYSLQNACFNGVYLYESYKMPRFVCNYGATLSVKDNVGFMNALKALLYDRYGFSPNEIEFRDVPNAGYGHTIQMGIVRDMALPIAERTRLGLKRCERTDPEYKVNLDN